ncbi:MAG TPA: type II toxin-antitoxin system VapC family toxin [Mycobacteriales bacterium]|nr:type II toxin-antitoxin system VapC family toxin [Mycobacteriales bacterium]
MLLLDVNVVLAAARDDHPSFPLVRPWFDDLIAGDEAFTVPTTVWHSFLRLVTNRRIFPVPTARRDALEFLSATCAQPHHLLISPGPRHLTVLERVCAEGDATGDLIPDAVIGALAVEHDCVVITLDRDFARFPSVRQRRLS